MEGLRKFPVDLSGLSPKEKALFKKLTLAAELLAPLYLRQKNNKYPGANFYPPDASREEIEIAAKKDPAILNPYTFVERDKSGKLIAIPYHLKFQKELKKISQLLNEAAFLSEDQNLKAYLKARAKDLLTTNYDKSNILWLKTENSKIGCVIGAFDRYLDKLFFKKRAYMAWIGILDKEKTKEGKRLTSMILASERKYLPGAKRAKISQVKVRVENTAIFSGLVADFMFVGNNLPSSADLYLIKKYGVIFTIFNPTAKIRFEKAIYPVFRAIFHRNFQKNYSQEELYQALFRTTILHETCHNLMRYEDATLRLQEFFPHIDEIYTNILGVKSVSTLLLKDVITPKEFEAIFIVIICWAIYYLTTIKEKPHRSAYATGFAILLNFLLKGKALKKINGTFKLDLQKTFIVFDQLSHILDYYIALGNRNEAKEFIKKYGSFELFQKYFSSKLRKIPGKI